MPKPKLVCANPTISDQTIGKWRRDLGKRSKAELIEFILQTACANRHVRRAVQSEYDLEVSNRDLIAVTRRAIHLATDFDDSDAVFWSPNSR